MGDNRDTSDKENEPDVTDSSAGSVTTSTAILFRKAIERNDITEIDNLIRNGFDVQNAVLDDRRNLSSIHILVNAHAPTKINQSANVKCFDILALLLHNFVDINARDVTKQTALHFASAKPNNSGLIKVLISSGADVNIADNQSHTALHIAATSGCRFNTRALLEAGADVNAVDSCGMTSLHIACKKKNGTALIDLLIRSGADVNLRDFDKGRQGVTPLHVACRHGNADNVKVLLERGTRIDFADCSGMVALHVAASRDVSGEIIPLLGKCKIDIDIRDNLFYETALHKAIKNRMYDNITTLVQLRANTNITDYHGNTAVHLAAMFISDVFTWTSLMKTGPSTLVKNKDNQTPLTLAMKYQNHVAANVIKQFEAGANSPKLSASPKSHHRASISLKNFAL